MVNKNAETKLFERLAEQLPAEKVAELREQYKRDRAADSRESRKRSKERTAKYREKLMDHMRALNEKEGNG